MSRSFRDEVGVAWLEPLGLAIDGQGHLAFNKDSPLGSMGVGRYLGCWLYLEKYNLMVLSLRKPSLDTREGDIRLRKALYHLGERRIKHRRHG